MPARWKQQIARRGTLTVAAVIAAAMGAGTAASGSDFPTEGSVPRDFLAYWSFDEAGGPAVYDSASIGIDGEVYGATRAPGIVGNALAFGGRHDYVEIPGDQGYPMALGALTEGSVSVWFKFDSIPGVDSVYPMFYLGSRDGKSSLIIELGHFSSNSALFFTVYQNGIPPQCFDTVFNLQMHTWYHFVAVVGPDFNTGYLNGEELVDRDYNYGTARNHYFLEDVLNKEVCWIGRGYFGNLPQDQFFDGVIDEVQIFDRPLSADEISRMYETVARTSAECALDPSVWPDDDGDGVPDECCVTGSPTLPAGTSPMNRYLALEATMAGAHAIRVTPVELPSRFDYLLGRSLWVSTVQDVSELPGRTDPISRSFRAASLQCEPVYANWGAFGPVYVSHEAIIPGGTYVAQAVKAGCGRETELNFSQPLMLTTSAWGDVTGRFADSVWTGPNGQVDVIADVVAVLEKFRNAPGALAKARTDLHPATPDRQITILDVVMANDAFRGRPYPFMPSETPCDD